MFTRRLATALRLFLLAPCFAVYTSPVALAGNIEFLPSTRVAQFDGAGETVLLDVDTDGDLDLVTGSYWTSKLSIGFNDGSGLYPRVVEYALPKRGRTLEAADINGDGIQDVVVACEDQGALILVYLSDGQGNLTLHSTQAYSGVPQTLRIGDVDGDGILDAVVGQFANWSVLRGDGQGGFHPQVDYGGLSGLRDLALEDFDGDGDLDPILAFGDNARIFKNDGTGAWLMEDVYMGSLCSGILAEDMNGDGVLDLVGTLSGSRRVTVRLGDGVGGFGPPHSVTGMGDGLRKSVPVDLDGDGDLDLATYRGDARVYITSNPGEGNLVAELSVNIGSNNTVDTVAGDVDGDGDQDLLIIKGSGRVEGFLNDTPQEDPFWLQTNHLLAGGQARLQANGANGGQVIVLVASLAGPGMPTYVPFFDTEVGLLGPRRMTTPQVVDSFGQALFEFDLPPGLQNRYLFFQALQFQNASQILDTAVY